MRRFWYMCRRAITFERVIWCGLLVMFAGVFFVIGYSMPSYTPRQAVSSAELAPESVPIGKIPLNTATKEQLMAVPGIGEVFATRIIDYRSAHGGFISLTQLKNVDGIGNGRYEQWKEYFYID